jgi:hypothetical protein
MMPAALSPARWSKTQSPVALMVIRLLLVGNVVVLATGGALCLVGVARPAGILGAALIWCLAAALLWLVPYTNPRRGDTSRW